MSEVIQVDQQAGYSGADRSEGNDDSKLDQKGVKSSEKIGVS